MNVFSETKLATSTIKENQNDLCNSITLLLGYYARISQMHKLQASLLEIPSLSNLNNSSFTIFSVLSLSVKMQKIRKTLLMLHNSMISNEHYTEMLWFKKAWPYLDSTFLLRYKDPGILKSCSCRNKIKNLNVLMLSISKAPSVLTGKNSVSEICCCHCCAGDWLYPKTSLTNWWKDALCTLWNFAIFQDDGYLNKIFCLHALW